jgi:hypothetical protein
MASTSMLVALCSVSLYTCMLQLCGCPMRRCSCRGGTASLFLRATLFPLNLQELVLQSCYVVGLQALPAHLLHGQSALTSLALSNCELDAVPAFTTGAPALSVLNLAGVLGLRCHRCPWRQVSHLSSRHGCSCCLMTHFAS